MIPQTSSTANTAATVAPAASFSPVTRPLRSAVNLRSPWRRGARDHLGHIGGLLFSDGLRVCQNNRSTRPVWRGSWARMLLFGLSPRKPVHHRYIHTHIHTFR